MSSRKPDITCPGCNSDHLVIGQSIIVNINNRNDLVGRKNLRNGRGYIWGCFDCEDYPGIYPSAAKARKGWIEYVEGKKITARVAKALEARS